MNTEPEHLEHRGTKQRAQMRGVRPDRQTRTQRLDDMLHEYARKGVLKSPAAFAQALEHVALPGEVLAALMSNRPELIKLAQPRPYSVEEVTGMLALVHALLETNAAHQEHTSQVALLVKNWADAFRGLRGIGRDIENFANFRPLIEDMDDGV